MTTCYLLGSRLISESTDCRATVWNSWIFAGKLCLKLKINADVTEPRPYIDNRRQPNLNLPNVEVQTSRGLKMSWLQLHSRLYMNAPCTMHNAAYTHNTKLGNIAKKTTNKLKHVHTRDGEPRNVNATRRDRMTCCCVETINNRRLFSLIKEQRRSIEKITGGWANFF